MMNDYIVSAEWLKEHLEDADLILIDCCFSLQEPHRGRKQYEEQHIPGAYYFDLNADLSSTPQKHGGRHPLPNISELAAKLSAIGVQSDNPSLIVAYDNSRFAFASRFWWLMRFLGHEGVVLLDGGFDAWKEKGYAVTSALPIASSGNFVPNPNYDWIVDIEAVKTAIGNGSPSSASLAVKNRKDLPGVVLIDSRVRERYLGEIEPIDPIAGHIPGAINYPWQEVTDGNGYIQPFEYQQNRWKNLEKAEEVIVYCGSGVTACVNLLSLAIAGIKTTKLYAGSWSDWCSYQNDD